MTGQCCWSFQAPSTNLCARGSQVSRLLEPSFAPSLQTGYVFRHCQGQWPRQPFGEFQKNVTTVPSCRTFASAHFAFRRVKKKVEKLSFGRMLGARRFSYCQKNTDPEIKNWWGKLGHIICKKKFPTFEGLSAVQKLKKIIPTSNLGMFSNILSFWGNVLCSRANRISGEQLPRRICSYEIQKCTPIPLANR